MERHVGTYQDEWATTLQDPAKLARFRTFINAEESDPDIVFVEEREQRRPAYEHELPQLLMAATD